MNLESPDARCAIRNLKSRLKSMISI
jgi:hypothetical protein